MELEKIFESNNWALRLEIEHQIATGRTTFRWLIVNRDQDNYEEQIRGKSQREFLIAAYSNTPDEIDGILRQLITDVWDVAAHSPLTSEGLFVIRLFLGISENIIEHAAYQNNQKNAFPYIVDCLHRP